MQLSLPLLLKVEYGEDNFVISSCNYEAYRAIIAENWYNSRVMIIGEQGSGKTHLASIWAKKNNAQFVDTNFSFNTYTNIVVEDIDTLCGRECEEFLFHLINYCQLNNLKLLFTANEAPAFNLKDLKSRMQATQYFLIEWPDSELIKFIMLKQFSDRQLEIPFSVIEYASKFLPRNFSSIGQFIAKIDEFSLNKKRNITLPFIKDYFYKESLVLEAQEAAKHKAMDKFECTDLQNLVTNEQITA